MAVIDALAEQPAVWRYGYELCQQLGMKAGSMYLGDAVSWLLLIVPCLMIPLGILGAALIIVVVRAVGQVVNSGGAAVGTVDIDRRTDS